MQQETGSRSRTKVEVGEAAAYHVITKRLEVGQHVRVEPGVGRAKVGRDDADDVDEGDLVLDDLIAPLLRRDGREVLVAPRMASDLAAGGVHALDDGRVASLVVLDLPLSAVRSHHEERCLKRWPRVSPEGVTARHHPSHLLTLTLLRFRTSSKSFVL